MKQELLKKFKKHNRIMFWASLVVGTGFCIAGIAVPVFASVFVPIGCVLLTGALGMRQSAFTEEAELESAPQEAHEHNQAEDNNGGESEDDKSVCHIENITETHNTVNQTVLFMYGDNHHTEEEQDYPLPRSRLTLA